LAFIAALKRCAIQNENSSDGKNPENKESGGRFCGDSRWRGDGRFAFA
jgi:hypothetical protein